MKISDLTQLSELSRDIALPVSIAGQNRSITLGQIMDVTATAGVAPFSKIYDESIVPSINDGSEELTIAGLVVWYEPNKRFYLAIGRINNVAGRLVKTWNFYEAWPKAGLYINEAGSVRTDRLFVTPNGRLYKFNGEDLISVGLTEEQENQLRLSTPIEVASEEEMEQRIAAGEIEDGQFYFLAEAE